MKEVYNKLNEYLNALCVYLEKENPFLLEYIQNISKLNDTFLKKINPYLCENVVIQNHLTYEEVYLLAREIIEQIDNNYLVDFDQLIQSGELDFSFNQDYPESECISMYNKNQVKQIININREFNYNDVRILVHEFLHYTNGKKGSKRRYDFTEFLSIYFEFYAIDYLFSKGINNEEIDYFHRLKNLKYHSTIFYQYEKILLAFVSFGNLNENTVFLLQQYSFKIKRETFEKYCRTLYKNLCLIEETYKEKIKDNPKILGNVLSEEFITKNYRYILGTFFAIYAYKNVNFKDVVSLNNRINELDDKSIDEICFSIGIDLKDENFEKNLILAIEEYINALQFNSKKLSRKIN